MKSYEEALEYITGHSDVWVTTGREIAEYYLEHYYDDAVRDIAGKQESKSWVQIKTILSTHIAHSEWTIRYTNGQCLMIVHPFNGLTVKNSLYG